MSGATEAILDDILRQATITNASLAAMLRQGGSFSGGSGSSVPTFTKSLGPASLALGALSAAGNLVSGVFSAIGSVLGKVIGAFTSTASNLYSFAQATAMGTSKLSDFYAAFKDIPILGTAFSFFSDFLKYQEQLLDSYQKLTNSGASFGGSLSAMRDAAARAYLSMDEFSQIVTTNSDIFSTMGGNVQGGLNRFVQLQNQMLGPNSEYGKMLAGLGYTGKAAAEVLALYMRSQGTMNKAALQSNDVILKGTMEYAEQLSTLSQLTGQNNEELRKQVEKVQQDELWKAYTSQLSPEKAAAINQLMTERIAAGGEEAGQSLKNAILGLNVPMNDAQVAMDVMSKGLLSRGNAAIVEGLRQGKSTADMLANERKNNLLASQTIKSSVTSLGSAATAMSKDVLVTAQTGYMRYGRTIEDLSKLNEKERAAKIAQQKQQVSEAASLERAQLGIKNFGNSLLTAVWGVIEPMTPILTKFATGAVEVGLSLVKLISSITGSDGFKEAIQGMTNWIKSTFKYLSGSENAKDFWGRLGNVMVDGWDKIKGPAIAIFDKFVDFLKPYMIKILDVIGDQLNAWVYNLPGGSKILGAENPVDRAARRVKEAELNAANDKINQLVAQLNIAKDKNDTEKIQNLEKDLKAATTNRNRILNPNENPNSAQAQIPVGRSTGSLGVTGKLFENWGAGTDVTLHGTEAVVTPNQMNDIVNNSTASELQTLNRLVAELVRSNREAVEYARRNVDATKGLSGNLFA